MTKVKQYATKSQLAQLMMENEYSKENIKKLISKEIEGCVELNEIIETTTANILEWCNQEHYDSKKEMLMELVEYQEKTLGHGIQTMLMDIMVSVIAGGQTNDLTAVVGQSLSCLPWDKGYEDIRILRRIGEILYHMAIGGLIEIVLPSDSDSGMLMIKHDWNLSDTVIETIAFSKFLPPMICKPNQVNNIKHSGYIKAKSKVMSKWWNQKNNGDLRYDYLNKRNATPYKLDMEYLTAITDKFDMAKEDKWQADIKVQEEQWKKFQLDTNKIAIDIYRKATKYGDGSIYFNHFYCNRMRTYVRGYHISPQGNSHRKAMVDFHETCSVEISDEYRDCF